MSLRVDLKHRFSEFSLDLGIDVPDGITVLFGRSGSGKSTVLRAIAGIFKPDHARIVLSDRVLCDSATGPCLPPHKRRIGTIFQDARLFPHLSVAQNLDFGRRFAKRDVSQSEVSQMVEMLGIGALLERRPEGLSGGEQQRVAIGRALLSGAEMILADEPLAALDEGRKAEILPYFERLRDDIGIPVLYVSHSPAEVARLATTVIALEAGRVIGQGSAESVLGDPAVLPVGTGGAGALIRARVRAHHDDGLTELDAGGEVLFLPHLNADPGHLVRLRIAAHEVILSPDRPVGLSALNILSGTIAEISEAQGPAVLVAVQSGAGRILARVTTRSVAALGLRLGAPCHAVVKTASIAQDNIG